MLLAVLADTHIPKRAKTLSDQAWALVKSADAILHAGDVLNEQFLSELRNFAPLYAVQGNNDLTLSLPEVLEIEFEGVKLSMIHDSGSKERRAARMRKKFPDANVVVFGHSHIPINQFEEGLLLFNPGSATDRRRQPHCTMGMLELLNGRVARAEIIQVD